VRSPYNVPTSTNAANTWCVLMLVGVGSESDESSESVTGAAIVFVVERKFFRLWLRFPFTVASSLGRFLRTKYSVRPGHVAKCPAQIAFNHVSGTGLNAAACKNRTRSRLFLHSYTLCASQECNVFWASTPPCMLVAFGSEILSDVCDLLPSKSTVQSLFRKFRCPSKMLAFLCKIWTFVLSKVMEQSASTNCPTESREIVERPGMTCAFFAVSGIWGRIKSQVCDDLMEAPSGRLTWIGVMATFLLVIGDITIR
jgi:hypothetical protein